MEVSVIIPVYNAASFLTRAVASALQQPEVKEVILVDDGSTDESLAIAHALAESNSSIKVGYHPENRHLTPSATRNRGIQLATCPYLAFLDADDWYADNRFRQTKYVFEENPTIDGVYERVDNSFDARHSGREFPHGDPGIGFFMPQHVPPQEAFSVYVTQPNASIHLNGVTLRRSWLLQHHLFFDEQQRTWEDVHFLRQALLRGQWQGTSNQEAVAYRRVHGANISFNPSFFEADKARLHTWWFRYMLQNNWPKNVNRVIMKQYIHYYPGKNPVQSMPAVFRFWVKGCRVFCLFARYPRLFFIF